MLQLSEDIKIPERRLKTILRDPEKTAAAVNLVYVNDQGKGILRVRKGKGFSYRFNNQVLRDRQQLDRIRRLVIPPAWKEVWICPLDNGHLQVTGTDLKKRKQYKYHTLWNSLRNQTKFYRLHSFGKAMPEIRRQLDAHLSLPGLPPEKVLAAVVSLMELTSIRVGNNLYEKLYGSFGLTTLKDDHVKIRGAELQFSFKGKKGVMHNISLKSKRLADIVRKCRDIPGKDLFQYCDKNGNCHCIDSGMVNNYIRTISGEDFSAKDFRTWSGSVQAIVAFRGIGFAENATGVKRNIVIALDSVSKHLGNTRTVCKKYYVHPLVLSLYECGRLHSVYFNGSGSKTGDTDKVLSGEEQLLLDILEKESLTIKC